jgi:hypothetical protein
VHLLIPLYQAEIAGFECKDLDRALRLYDECIEEAR